MKRNKFDGTCSLCLKPRDSTGAYCRKCRAAYQKKWRKGRKETPAQKEKAKIRYNRYYETKGRETRRARYQKSKNEQV